MVLSGWYPWNFQDIEGQGRLDYPAYRDELRRHGANCTRIFLMPGPILGRQVWPPWGSITLLERLQRAVFDNNKVGIYSFVSLNLAGNNLGGWWPAGFRRGIREVAGAINGLSACLEVNEPGVEDWPGLLENWPHLVRAAKDNGLDLAFNCSSQGPFGALPDLSACRYRFAYGRNAGSHMVYAPNALDGDHLGAWLSEHNASAQKRMISAAHGARFQVVMMPSVVTQNGKDITLPPYQNWRWPDWQAAATTFGEVAYPKSEPLAPPKPAPPPEPEAYLTAEQRAIRLMALVARTAERRTELSPEEIARLETWEGRPILGRLVGK